jgi:hypothetical protein
MGGAVKSLGQMMSGRRSRVGVLKLEVFDTANTIVVRSHNLVVPTPEIFPLPRNEVRCWCSFLHWDGFKLSSQ